MSQTAIHVDGLWKQYKIGSKRSTSFRESVNGILKKTKTDNRGQFWALKDVNFEISKGEAIGIIGKNGAGKSTLLKILSKITYPTKGLVEMHGRVSSLLEVGTGFHPELSGRQNIFLNGTILGMKRQEIQLKFDEIVAFSGVEKFIDTPVKHYSSGMKVRLAFSVAAHLEPEILIIDEVLAVGDAEFQKKCLGKMENVTGEGRTVLFVSHNLAAVSRLCKTGLMLHEGSVKAYGSVDTILSQYAQAREDKVGAESLSVNFEQRSVSKFLSFDSLELQPSGGSSEIMTGQSVQIIIKYKILDTSHVFNGVHFSIAIRDLNDQNVLHLSSRNTPESTTNDILKKSDSVILTIDELALKPGRYNITINCVQSLEFLDVREGCLGFNIKESTSPLFVTDEYSGIFIAKASWDFC